MDLKSLEDLWALIEVRNVTLAARRRHISQSAYSRRLQAIEAHYGVQLVDRSGRPARPTAVLDSMRSEIERTRGNLRRLQLGFTHGSSSERYVGIAAVHALACGLLPAALSQISQRLPDQHIHLRAANQDQCLQMLMTEQVGAMFVYETEHRPLLTPPELTEKTKVAEDAFIPVCAPARLNTLIGDAASGRRLPHISYPSDLFLGQVLFDEILTRTRQQMVEVLVTSFTSAVMAAAIQGLGVAWLPLSMAQTAIDARQLADLRRFGLPSVRLDVVMVQINTRSTSATRRLWDALGQEMRAAGARTV